MKLKSPTTLFLLLAATLWGAPAGSNANPTIHSVVDLGHEFSFYGDGRFQQQYLPGQAGATSWGALFNYDLSNANLLVLLACDSHLSYLPQDRKTISSFLADGGGVLLLSGAAGRLLNELAIEPTPLRVLGVSGQAATIEPTKF